jgi:carboxyl-terminal processing protease
MSKNWVYGTWFATCMVLAMAVGAGIAKAQSDEKPAAEEAAAADPAATPTEADEYYELMRVFVDTFQEIDRNYVKEVDRRELIEAAVRGMLAELDPYSDYIPPDDLKGFTESVEQEFSGVGIRVKFDEASHSIEVTSPLPGSPAYKAGIQAGDKIVSINGKQVNEFETGREIETAIEMLRGKEGESVDVGIKHQEEDVKQVTLTRAVITLDTVLGNTPNADGTWDFMLDKEKKIAYIRLTHFTRRSAQEMRDAVRQLKRDDMQGLILDLRYNPGGLLQSAVEIADLFIESGEIVRTEGRNVPTRTYTAKAWGTYSDFPIAVLVNRYSASASEILSASLQDHKRAVVVGERSWGKGSVQNVIDMEDSKAALKLTTAYYHRPSGKKIHREVGETEDVEWGVKPDEGYEVKFSMDEMRAQQEDRRDRDVPGAAAPEHPFEDKQLAKAVEYLTSELAKKSTPSENAPEEKAAEPQGNKENKKAASLPQLRNPLSHSAG